MNKFIIAILASMALSVVAFADDAKPADAGQAAASPADGDQAAAA